MQGVMTPEEAAEYLRLHEQTVYRGLRRGQLPGAKIGNQWRILKADLDNYLRGNWQPAQEDEASDPELEKLVKELGIEEE